MLRGLTDIARDTVRRWHPRAAARARRRQAEEALRAAALAQLPGVLVACEAGGRVALVEGAALGQAGLDRDALQGRALARRWGGQEWLRTLLRRALDGEEVREEVALGETRWSFAARPVRAASGAVEGALAQGTEITARAQRQEVLEREHECLRRVATQLKGLLWTTDEQLRVTSHSGGFWPLAQMPLGDGDSLSDRQLHLAAQRALAGEQVDLELLWRGRTIRLLVQPLLGPGGKVEGTLGFAFDVTERRAAELHLREWQAQAEALLANAGEAIWSVDREYRLLYANDTFLSLMHASTGKMPRVGELLLPYAAGDAPDEAPRWRALYDRALSGESVVEEQRARIDGRERHFVFSLRPIITAQIITGVAGYTRDVSAWREAERRVRESEERFSRLFETCPAPVIVTLLEDGRVVDLNPAAERLYLVPRAEALGRTTVELGLWHDAEQRARLVKAVRATGSVRDYEARVHLRDGSEHFLVGSASLLTLGGKTHMVLVAEDVTERKRLVDELRRSREHLARVFQILPVPLVIARLPGCEIMEANDAARTVFGLGETSVGRPVADLGLWAYPDEHRRFLDLVAREGQVRDYEAAYRSPTGEVRQMLLAATQLEVGGTPGLLVAAEDVTERRRLEEQLLQAGRMQAFAQLAGGVAHDFNNLLTVVGGNAERQRHLLEERRMPTALVDQIAKAAARGGELTRQLLAFGRRQVLQPSVLDLNQIVVEALPALRRVLGPDVELVTSLSPDLAPVRADREQLEQVLFQLAANAHDAMPGGGRLVIHTSNAQLGAAGRLPDGGDDGHQAVPPGSYALLAVSDTGVGMDERTKEHAFEPFFTTKGPGVRRGLGLSSVYGIVQQSEGHILVQSRPGEGTTVQIYLPHIGQPASQAKAPARRAGRTSATPTVLLVEDEPDLRELLQDALESDGFHVLTAQDGQEAVQKARTAKEPIDVLVTDVVMPRMGGPDAAAEVRRVWPDVRVLFMSGFPGDALPQLVREVPTSAFLQKPFSLDLLGQRLHSFLAPSAQPAAH